MNYELLDKQCELLNDIMELDIALDDSDIVGAQYTELASLIDEVYNNIHSLDCYSDMVDAYGVLFWIKASMNEIRELLK